MSCTVIVKEQSELFPAASVAVQVTVVVPRLKLTPFNVVNPDPRVAPPRLTDTEANVQLSVALAFQVFPV